MWLVYALATAIFYTGLDYFVKKTAGKIDDFLGSVIINFFAVLPALAIWLWLKISNQQILYTKEGGLYSILAGLSIGIGTITFLKMYASGANLSLGSPLVRIGTVALVTLVGILILKEPLSTKQVLGLVLSIVGLSLLVFK